MSESNLSDQADQEGADYTVDLLAEVERLKLSVTKHKLMLGAAIKAADAICEWRTIATKAVKAGDTKVPRPADYHNGLDYIDDYHTGGGR